MAEARQGSSSLCVADGPGDIDVFDVAGAAAGDDGDIVQSVSSSAFFTSSDLDFHEPSGGAEFIWKTTHPRPISELQVTGMLHPAIALFNPAAASQRLHGSEPSPLGSRFNPEGTSAR